MAQTHKVSGVATNIRTENGKTVVRYHSTDVVSFNDEVIELNTDGWFTNTTKTRMNQTSSQFGLGFSVMQKKGQWLVGFKGQVFAFNGNTLTLER